MHKIWQHLSSYTSLIQLHGVWQHLSNTLWGADQFSTGGPKFSKNSVLVGLFLCKFWSPRPEFSVDQIFMTPINLWCGLTFDRSSARSFNYLCNISIFQNSSPPPFWPPSLAIYRDVEWGIMLIVENKPPPQVWAIYGAEKGLIYFREDMVHVEWQKHVHIPIIHTYKHSHNQMKIHNWWWNFWSLSLL